jgi:carbamoyl-phosphate synthase small subunit
VAYDYGVKRNILRMLVDRGCELTVVPAQTPATTVLAMQPDGVFLSNGPGDPEPCDYAIAAIRDIVETGTFRCSASAWGTSCWRSRAARALVKMKFGHHGANHPVQDLDDRTVLITSQNHGFAADEATLPATLRATHRSLFDGSLQGIARTTGQRSASRATRKRAPDRTTRARCSTHFVELMTGAPRRVKSETPLRAVLC